MVPIEPGWLSLLPPLAAIALALVFREVVLSLFAGVWLGALFLAGWDPLEATLMSVDRFVLGALAESPDHMAIVVFSLMLGGMVGVMTRSGGTQGVVESLRSLATSRRRGQFLTWLAGVLIFFDDYANTLIVGNTMRPVTDRLKVSREKLAYIVDSTAAPMAAIGIISTWIGFEITLVGDSLTSAAGQVADPAASAELLAAARNGFAIFLHSIPYLFYPIFALFFVLLTVLTRRDFGPMREAELRAANDGGLHRPDAMLTTDTSAELMDPPDGTPRRWFNAAVPVVVVIVTALIGLYTTGMEGVEAANPSIRDIIGASDPFKALIWGSFLGSVVAIALATGQRLLSISASIEAWVGGMRAMFLAMIILTLAWGLGGVTEAIGTGPYLSGVLQDTLPMRVLPVLVFLVAAGISFATGSSWGTLAILFPVAIPLAVSMGAGVGFGDGSDYTVLLGVISSVMAGSIFGDHCSPISDTTVLSSMASACDHVDHVRTQLPYALTVGGVAMLVGDIPTAFGLSPLISLVLGLVILYGALRVVGRRTEAVETVEAEPVVADMASAAPAD